jgi:Na+/H+ antiporter NhaD/arsenite permease-like protein
MVALFFFGQPPAKATIIIGDLLLLTRRVKSERVYAEIDWSLLLMFAGLLSAATAVPSNLVSNVPALLIMKPFVQSRRITRAHG